MEYREKFAKLAKLLSAKISRYIRMFLFVLLMQSQRNCIGDNYKLNTATKVSCVVEVFITAKQTPSLIMHILY